jgi:hypothetical protein
MEEIGLFEAMYSQRQITRYRWASPKDALIPPRAVPPWR